MQACNQADIQRNFLSEWNAGQRCTAGSSCTTSFPWLTLTYTRDAFTGLLGPGRSWDYINAHWRGHEERLVQSRQANGWNISELDTLERWNLHGGTWTTWCLWRWRALLVHVRLWSFFPDIEIGRNLFTEIDNFWDLISWILYLSLLCRLINSIMPQPGQLHLFINLGAISLDSISRKRFCQAKYSRAQCLFRHSAAWCLTPGRIHEPETSFRYLMDITHSSAVTTAIQVVNTSAGRIAAAVNKILEGWRGHSHVWKANKDGLITKLQVSSPCTSSFYFI